MPSSYMPLHNRGSSCKYEDSTWHIKEKSASSGRLLGICVVLLLLITNLTTIYHFSVKRRTEPVPPQYAKTDSIAIDTAWMQFWWNTDYSPKNHSDSDALWDAILPSHGFVAMDRKWATQQQWPESMYLPSDTTKGIYLLEAYHQLHCLKIIRKTFWEAVERRSYTHHPSGHMEHCFDTLRQSVQCYADSTPLYTFGDFTAGDGQLHKCRNWHQLRDFATENTACYKDTVEDVLLKEHFGVCDDGSDGLA